MRKTFKLAGGVAGILLCLVFAGRGYAAQVDVTSPYSGAYFMAYSTALSSSAFPPSSGTMPAFASLLSSGEKAPSPAAEIVEVHTDKDGRPMYRFELRDIMDVPETVQPTARLFSARIGTPTVGEEREFKAYHYTDQETFDALFTLKYSGEYCNIWQKSDDTLQVTQEMAAELGAEFDVNIHDRMVSAFGPIYDRDGDGKTAILLYDIPDGYIAGSSTPYTAGFFLNGDMWRDDCNNMDALHIDTYPSIFYDGDWELDLAKSTLAHELQHLIEASSCVTTGRKQLPIWVNEGLSMAAEHMIYGPQAGRIKDYNQSYQPGDPLMEWNGTLSNYSLSYLFFQYLRIQTQDFSGGGLEMFRQIIESEDRTSLCVERGMRQFYPYITMDQLIRNFYIALTLRENTGLYGFGGEDAFHTDKLQVKLYSSTASKELRPGGAIINKMSAASHTAYPSGPVHYAAFGPGGNGVDTPVADVLSGQVYQFQNVSLSCSEPCATIYYTMNGSQPDEDSLVYDGSPISIYTTNTTDLNVNIPLKAITITPDGRKSDVSSYQYTLRGEQVELVRRTEGSSDVMGYGAAEAVEKDGIVQVGSFSSGAAGTGDLYGAAVPTGCSTIAYIAKYTHKGRQEWLRPFGGDDKTVLYDITAVSDGYVAAGYMEWSSSSHTGDFAELSLPGNSGKAAILVKFDAQGNIRWITPFPAAKDNSCLYAVAACPDGSVAAVGTTDSTAYTPWPNDFSTLKDGSGKALAVKTDGQGNLRWRWTSSAGGCYSFRDVAVLSDGTVTAAGSSGTNAVIYAFQGQDGSSKWSHINKSNNAIGFLGVAALANDTIVAVGHSSKQGIVAAYSSSGANQWTKAIDNGSNAAEVFCVDVVPGESGDFLTLLSFGLPTGFGGTYFIGQNGFLADTTTVGYASCPAVILRYDASGNCVGKNGYSSRYSNESDFRYVSASLVPLGKSRYTVSGHTTGPSPMMSRTPHAFVLTFSDESGETYHTVSGNVGLPGVSIGGTVSDSDGSFRLRVKDGESVTLEPALKGYTFSNSPLPLGPVTEDNSTLSFTPSPITYTLSGTIRDRRLLHLHRPCRGQRPAGAGPVRESL